MGELDRRSIGPGLYLACDKNLYKTDTEAWHLLRVVLTPTGKLTVVIVLSLIPVYVSQRLSRTENEK